MTSFSSIIESAIPLCCRERDPPLLMGIALAVGEDTDDARALAAEAARKIRIDYRD